MCPTGYPPDPRRLIIAIRAAAPANAASKHCWEGAGGCGHAEGGLRPGGGAARGPEIRATPARPPTPAAWPWRRRRPRQSPQADGLLVRLRARHSCFCGQAGPGGRAGHTHFAPTVWRTTSSTHNRPASRSSAVAAMAIAVVQLSLLSTGLSKMAARPCAPCSNHIPRPATSKRTQLGKRCPALHARWWLTEQPPFPLPGHRMRSEAFYTGERRGPSNGRQRAGGELDLLRWRRRRTTGYSRLGLKNESE